MEKADDTQEGVPMTDQRYVDGGEVKDGPYSSVPPLAIPVSLPTGSVPPPLAMLLPAGCVPPPVAIHTTLPAGAATPPLAIPLATRRNHRVKLLAGSLAAAAAVLLLVSGAAVWASFWSSHASSAGPVAAHTPAAQQVKDQGQPIPEVAKQPLPPKAKDADQPPAQPQPAQEVPKQPLPPKVKEPEQPAAQPAQEAAREPMTEAEFVKLIDSFGDRYNRRRRQGTRKVEEVQWLHPLNFKLGQKGEITTNPYSIDGFGPADYWFEVESVVSDNEVLIREAFSGRNSTRKPITFMVEMPTKGLADDALIRLKGVMEIVDTKRVGRATYFVLRPAAK